MRKNAIKSIVLILLIAASVYQIILVWSYNSTGKNGGIASIIDASRNTLQKEYSEKHIITPKVLSVYFEENNRGVAVIKKTNLNYENIYNDSFAIIGKALESGTYTESLSNLDIMWMDRSLLFSLQFSIYNDLIKKDLDVSKSIYQSDEPIAAIGMVPATQASQNIYVYIIEEDNDIYTYALSKEEVSESNMNINSYLSTIESSQMPPYLSSIKEGIGDFSNNVLLPIELNESMYETNYYEDLIYQNRAFCDIPFINGEGFDLENLESYVKGFFVNSDVKWSLQKDAVVKYGADNILITYNQDGLLDYTNVTTVEEGNTDITLAYNIVEEFLEKDSLLIQKYYLSEYTINEDGITFYFEYTFDDFPFVISQELLDQYEMMTPLEVTICNETVKAYKRIVLQIEESNQNREKYSGDYKKVIQAMREVGQIGNQPIDNMYLGYYWNSSNFADIVWVIETDEDKNIGNIF